MAEKGNKKKTSAKSVKKTAGAKKKATKTAGKSATTKKKKTQKATATKEKVAVDLNTVAALHPVSDESNDENNCPPLEEKFFANDTIASPVVAEVAEPIKDDSVMTLKLSQSLLKKIKKQAEDEGISLEDFATELLAEGVVLRAWEIVERKSQMRSPSNNNSNSHNNHQGGSNHRGGNNQQNRGNRGQKGHRGMSHGRYQSIMDDKATFLEYVRNQERLRR